MPSSKSKRRWWKWLVLVSQRQILNLLTAPVFIFHSFFLRQQEDFSILFCILSFTEGKQYGVLLRGEMTADRTFKAKLELRYFHVRLPSETEWDVCSGGFGGREGHSFTSFWDKQNFIAVLNISWPPYPLGTFFPLSFANTTLFPSMLSRQSS